MWYLLMISKWLITHGEVGEIEPSKKFNKIIRKYNGQFDRGAQKTVQIFARLKLNER